MRKIVALDLITLSAPVQWLGMTADGAEIFIRFRHDRLRVEIGGKTVFEKHPVFGKPGPDVTIEQVCELAGLELACKVQDMTTDIEA